MKDSKCGDTCEGDKKIVVYPRRLSGWRRCVLNCSQCGEVCRFDYHTKKGSRAASDSVWDRPVLTVLCAAIFFAFAFVHVVQFARMFSSMDLESFAVWCFMVGGVAILVYGVTRE